MKCLKAVIWKRKGRRVNEKAMENRKLKSEIAVKNMTDEKIKLEHQKINQLWEVKSRRKSRKKGIQHWNYVHMK